MLDILSVELLKELDSQSLTELAGLVHDLQLEFGPAEGFQTAFRMLIHQAGRRTLLSKHTPSSPKKRSHEQQKSVAADNEDDAVHEVQNEALLSKDAAQALATATFQLTRVWEKKVLDKDVLDEIRDHMQNNVANFGLVPEKMF
ncbi:TPA: hypothetical protein ACH3X1_000764 [Trebouxia sp. C0004]